MCVILSCNPKRLIFFSGGAADEPEYHPDNDRGRAGRRHLSHRPVLFPAKKQKSDSQPRPVRWAISPTI